MKSFVTRVTNREKLMSQLLSGYHIFLIRIVVIATMSEKFGHYLVDNIAVIQEFHGVSASIQSYQYQNSKLLIINSDMVKIATITQQPLTSVTRSPKAQHPFSRAREFQRATNATKLHKMFAKPFLAALQGHSDGVSVIAKCPLLVNRIISGAHDGQIRLWDLSERKTLISLYEHKSAVKGVSFSKDGLKFLSSSLDKSINLYDFKTMIDSESMSNSWQIHKQKNNVQPLTKYLSRSIIGNVDHSPANTEFATSGQAVQIWSYQRTKPIYQLEWNVDSILKVKYNWSDPNLLCASCSDRSLILFDLRGETAVQKITLPNKSMCLCFNPLEPINITAGNDDSNSYSFDIRRLDRAKIIHKGHIGAVTDIDFASSGRQFVTGSFDRTLRIFNFDSGSSKEVYHAKRMQIVSSIQYTVDSHYILSGSQDMNIRLWKSVAWRPNGKINNREERAQQYRDQLISKFKESNKIRRINNHRHLPKYIVNANARRQDQKVKKLKKKLNVQANTGVVESKVGLKKKLVEAIQVQQEQFPQKKQKSGQEEEQQFNDE